MRTVLLQAGHVLHIQILVWFGMLAIYIRQPNQGTKIQLNEVSSLVPFCNHLVYV